MRNRENDKPRDGRDLRGGGDGKARFARQLAHAEFGRFYASGRDLEQVALSNAKTLKRIQQERKIAEKARPKPRGAPSRRPE